MTKLIIINGLPTSRIFGEKVDPCWYQRNGFDVEFWDISSLYFTKAQLEAYYSSSEDYKFIGPNHKVFSSKKAVELELERLNKSAYIWNLSWNTMPAVDDFWLLRKFKKEKVRYFIKVFENSLPQIRSNKESSKDKIFTKFKNVNLIIATLKAFKRFIFNKANYYKKPNFFVGVGLCGRRRFLEKFTAHTKFISIPSPNVLWSDERDNSFGNYNLFVDESIVGAPDARLLGYEVSDDSSVYISNMKRVFEVVEKVTGFPVIIAASGKTDYEKNVYGARRIIYKQTAKLSRCANLVLGHSSGGLYQSVCDNKPIILIDDPTFSAIKKDSVLSMAKLTNIVPVLSTDFCSSHISNVFKVDGPRYEKCVAEYFREPGVVGDYREIIAQHLHEK